MSHQRELFEALFNDHFSAVLTFALARSETEVAKDVTADTFLAAWRAFDQLPAAPRGWLLAVARRKLVDQYRATGRRLRLAKRLEDLHTWVTPDHGDGHAEQDRILRAFARLRPRDQELLRLISWDGLTPQEAAEVLHVSNAAFSVRLHRARQRLQHALDVEDDLPPRPSSRTRPRTSVTTTQETS
ncbi:MAG: polymerase [Frankiales bacterium]|nr:polymerase [Frankiales bacterium]